MIFHSKKFNELTVRELYEIMKLRQEVFVVEQNCAYLDADGNDLEAIHVFSMNESKDQCLCLTRILPMGLHYPNHIAIGRVVTHPNTRGTGLGIKLMQESLDYCKTNLPGQAIKLSAQAHLQKFYNKFGFIAVGEEYLEDDIPHIAMIKNQ